MDDQMLMDAVYHRFMENITRSSEGPMPGTYIPHRRYCQGTADPGGVTGQTIQFATVNGGCFPVKSALAGQCNLLANGCDQAFTDQKYTINLRIEWPGYEGWGMQIRTVNYQEEPKGITRAKLVREVAKQLEKFIEQMKNVAIDPEHAEYRVGPGGIELHQLQIDLLEKVSRGSWQPRFFYSGA